MRHDHGTHDHEVRGGILTSRVGLVFLAFIVIAGILLFTEHRVSLLGALIYVPLFLCLLMHLFMHRGHGQRRPAFLPRFSRFRGRSSRGRTGADRDD